MVPIWMGGVRGEYRRGGSRNSLKTLEKNNIGWAFWPYKRMGKPSVVVNILPPADWERLWNLPNCRAGLGTWKNRL